MRVCSIHQPDYMPYMGVLYKMFCADSFVFLDDVQFSKSNPHNWNTIEGGQRIRIPVEYKFGDTLRMVRPKYELGWCDKHLEMIKKTYEGYPYYYDGMSFCSYLYHKFSVFKPNLDRVGSRILEIMSHMFGIDCVLSYSSCLGIESKKEDLVIDITKKMGCDVYISGMGAANYQDEEHFKKKGVKLIYTNYEPVCGNLSVIDYVMKYGFNLPEEWKWKKQQLLESTFPHTKEATL